MSNYIEKIINVQVDTKEAVADINKVDEAIVQTERDTQQLGEGNKTVFGALDNLLGGNLSKLKDFGSGIRETSKTFGGLKTAIIGTGLGALLILVTSVIEYFRNFEGGVKLVTKTMDVLGSVVNNIVGSFDKLLSGNFKEFFGDIKDGAIEAAENVDKLFEAQRRLAGFNEKAVVANAKLRQEIEKQKKITEDTTLSLEKRLEAQTKINENAAKLIKNERTATQLEKDRLNALLANENNYEKQRELRQQIADVDANLIDKETELNGVVYDGEKIKREMTKAEEDRLKAISEKRQQDANQRTALAKQEKEALIKVEQDYVKRLEDLNAKTDSDRLELEKKRSLEAIEAMKGSEEDKEKARLSLKSFYNQKEKELEDNKVKLEEQRQKSIADIRQKYATQILDLTAKTIQEEEASKLLKLEREKETALLELEQKNATEAEKVELFKFFQLEEQRIKKESVDAQKQIDDLKNQAFVNGAQNTLSLIGGLLKEGTTIAKGVAATQATITGIEGVQNAYTTAQKSPITALFPGYPLVQAGLAGAFSALQVKKILSTNTASTSASTNSVGNATPNFNIVESNNNNQLGGLINARQSQPLQAFVVGSAVSSQMALDRNILQNSTFL
jgi:hypothetical protein